LSGLEGLFNGRRVVPDATTAVFCFPCRRHAAHSGENAWAKLLDEVP
jgi:hypothetical protein